MRKVCRRMSSRRPLLLDLFCGAGGCAVGYQRAGFDVVGVDHKMQQRFPFEFHQADAMEYLSNHGHLFDAIHASPPCQLYSRLFYTMEDRRSEHPDLIGLVRAELLNLTVPWVIENVYGAPLNRGSVMLCGSMFGLRTYRHRWFETSWFATHPQHPKHRVKSDSGLRRKEHFLAGGFISVVGDVGSYCGHAAMGIDWMTGSELSQAIPPAYTEFIGKQLMAAIGQ